MSSGHDIFRATSIGAIPPYAVRITTHYEVLGVPSDASFDTIRAAYRERARRLHPDRTGTGGAARMAAVNEAYRVLGEPGRRAVYDRTLSAPQPAPGGGPGWSDGDVHDTATVPAERSSPLAPSGPARVPWKLMAITAVLGSGLILFAAAFNDPPSQEPPDGILRVGSCVEIEANGDAREVACTNTDADIVVELLLPTGASCPAELAAHRDRLGLGTACIPYD